MAQSKALVTHTKLLLASPKTKVDPVTCPLALKSASALLTHPLALPTNERLLIDANNVIKSYLL